MKLLPLLTLLFVLGAPAAATASPLYYWSFNNSDLEPDIVRQGSDTEITLEVLEEDLWKLWSEDFYDTGTELGIAPGYSAGVALAHFELVGVLTGLRVTVSGLNFSGLDGIEMSFAARNVEIGEFGELFQLETYTDGSWNAPSTLTPNPNGSWRLYEPSLAGALDNQADAKIRITSSASFELSDILSFDNLLFVPEPRSLPLALAAGLLLFLRRGKALLFR